MNRTYEVVIALMKSALSGQPVTLAEEIDWEAVFCICRKHFIVPLVYYGIVNSNIQVAQKEGFFNHTMQSVMQEQEQLFALETLKKEFSSNGIDHLPLKGAVLKALYPSTEMRVMSDLDILIREEQLGLVRKVMDRIGYTQTEADDHVVVFHKPTFLNVEIHTKLVPTYDTESYLYFKAAWEKAVPVADHPYLYQMSKEDTLIFVFAHLAKHYRRGGIGIRQFVDVWMLLTRYPDMDAAYIKKELRQLGLDAFYENVVRTLQCWFADTPKSELIAFLTKRTFESGAYGTFEQFHAGRAAEHVMTDSNKKNRIWKEIIATIFLPLPAMRLKYPMLKKAPVLLPVMWVVRWIQTLLFKPKHLLVQKRRIEQSAPTVVERYASEMAYVGFRMDLKRLESEPQNSDQS